MIRGSLRDRIIDNGLMGISSGNSTVDPVNPNKGGNKHDKEGNSQGSDCAVILR